MCAAFPTSVSTYPSIAADVATPYQQIRFDTWEEAKQQLSRYEAKWIFRGQRDASWKLETSLERDALGPLRHITHYPPKRVEHKIFIEYERALVEEFKKGAHLYLQGFPVLKHTLEWLALMQHYGTPTRLLDFTVSPYVAAFFAFRDPGGDKDRAIWVLNSEACAAAARTKYRQDERLLYQIFHEDGPQHKPTFYQDMEDNKLFNEYLTWAPHYDHATVVPLASSVTNERMFVQQGLFVMPSNIAVSFMENVASIARVEGQQILYQLIIPNSERMLVLADLDQMNINDLSLFPGLEGYARLVSRRLLLGHANAWRPTPSPAATGRVKKRAYSHVRRPRLRRVR
jgi:FRG domain